MENTTNTDCIDDPFSENDTSTITRVNINKQPAPALAEQAVSLFTPGSGWTYLPAGVEGLFVVQYDPIDERYVVFLGSETSSSYCTCKQWRAEAVCVHLLAIQYEQDWLADIVAREQMMDDAEHPEYGSDPYMQFDRGY